MDPEKSSTNSNSFSQGAKVIGDQRSIRPKSSNSSVITQEHSTKQSTHPRKDAETVDTTYKIVYTDRNEYPLDGHVYFRYNIPPIRESISWFCIVAFYWHDVQAELECVYHPKIKLFDSFKPVKGSVKGGSRGVQSVQISMWNFADRGPYLNAKHTVNDDNGNRLMLAVMIMGDGSAVRLRGKLVREGEDENKVWLSQAERGRVGLRP